MAAGDDGSLRERFFRSLRPHSSQVDWCEPNYAMTSHIAEFFNTVSNLPFLAVPLLMMYLFGPYGRRVSSLCHLVLALIIVVGMGSAYFHGALSLAGQLLDELAILWVIMSAATLWVPKSVLPDYFVKHQSVFRVVMVLVTVVMTWLGCVHPVVNHLILISLSIPVTVLVFNITRRSGERAVRTLGVRSLVLLGAAVTCWISDQAMCGLWRAVGFPYLHSIWHVTMVFATYDTLLFLAFTDTLSQHGNLRPLLKVWGRTVEPGPLSIMYIDFKSPEMPIYMRNNNYCKLD